ncbi:MULTISPECIES: type II toxin-antitoxin system VapC family toxin [unclassified Nodularia (in: cyanobacteria)]|uniref:type II toxin-antitoxin system VapC family toxin n=1 Tax=unclassified Nodularia (in: cyanobacteria) TaxID=2656917 RepID=UPI001881657B|nr:MULTISPECIES: type II toxin-antitoxin system VapC family toxin [unclassified Nodularia (in: cyanobacteria)]MBE9199093.1 type II toxin-antitoxin system VapC family toxin [Nodularia sp. LEGE 06071]MCC2695781.1 type II toxin-antitoxin system VapC family toxin [Nodularia sp. LEGE 04288]
MMFLLDTHTFIWYVMDNSRLSNQVIELINDENNQIFVSVVSLWEIAIKQSIGKLTFNQPLPFEIFITQQLHLNNFSLLDIKISHVAVISSLPLHHRDPFDRLLIAQSIVENIPLLSADQIFDAYPIQRLW